MAKKREDKGRLRRRNNNNKVEESDDSDSALNDTASVMSGASCASLNHVEIEDKTDEEDVLEVDNFESKFDAVLDYLQDAKSAKSKKLQYESLAKALTTRYCFEVLDTRKITMQDILEHGLRRSDDEAGFASFILSLILITMGTSDFCNEIFRELFVYLDRIMMDTTAKPNVRSKCAAALSLGCFITDYGMEKTRQLLGELLTVGFTTVKGHPDASQLNAIHAMKATCIDMFSFLVSIESDDYLSDSLQNNIDQLTKCLDSPNLSLRIAAGECIALLLEKSREIDEDYELDQISEICDKLQILATDSQKSKSKKELREQRSNFRQILRTAEGEAFGEETIKFGHERVSILCWQDKRYYDTFCSVLGSGMNLHLTQNGLLRDIFDLGAVLADNGSNQKISKFQKNYMNNFNSKVRKINRGKQRGKRADFDV